MHASDPCIVEISFTQHDVGPWSMRGPDILLCWAPFMRMRSINVCPHNQLANSYKRLFGSGSAANKADDSMVELDLTGGNVSPSSAPLEAAATPTARLAPTSDDDFTNDNLLALGGLHGDA